MRIKYWCDSGANIHSCNEGYVTLEELGLTREEWEAMSDKEKDVMMYDYAHNSYEWGYAEEE
jgi:hypothetical protein